MKRRRHSTGEVCETSRRGHPYSHRNIILLAAVLKMNPKLFPIANFLSEKKSTGLLSAFVEEPKLQASD
jgi:hypothetical protein